MEIKAKSRYDYDSVKALIRAASFKKDNPKTVYIVSMVWGALLAAMILIAFLVYGWMDMYYYLLGLIFFLLFFSNFAYLLIPKLTFKRMATFQNIENEFVLRDDTFTVISKNGDYVGEAEVKYSIIPKIIETSEYLFIYRDNAQAYIVDKSTIEGGTAEELRNVLQAKINGKYIICKY